MFAVELRYKGVAAVGADGFAVSASPNAVRICLGGPTDRAACRQALKIVEEAVWAVPLRGALLDRLTAPGGAKPPPIRGYSPPVISCADPPNPQCLAHHSRTG